MYILSGRSLRKNSEEEDKNYEIGLTFLKDYDTLLKQFKQALNAEWPSNDKASLQNYKSTTPHFHFESFAQCLVTDPQSNVNVMDVIYLVILVISRGVPAINPLFSRFPISLESPVLTDPLVSLRAMAPCKTKQPLELSSVAAPVAVGRVNAKGASRRPSAHPVGLSQTRSKATTTQLDAVVSAEEFDLQGIDDDDEISDISGPPIPRLS
ncbi:hypothetical protein F5888DRAFT_1806960 [Russula emetica]|nr:hypothetical protein F5888DRAFT_1806960 [Russula emetica]